MKAAVLHAFDEKLTAKEFVKYEDVADPTIGRSSEVIVRIGGAGVCRTDLHIVEGIWRSKVDINLPYIMGHENAGWVEAVGKNVQPTDYYVHGYIAGITAATDLFEIMFDAIDEMQECDKHYHEVIERRMQQHDKN